MHKNGSVTIAASASASSAIEVKGYREVAFAIPAEFTGAEVTFQRSFDGGATFTPANDDSDAAFTQAVSASTSYNVPTDVLAGATHIKIVSNGSEAAERSIAFGANS